MSWIKTQSIATEGEPIAAFYNPPWTLPFMKRTEYHIALED